MELKEVFEPILNFIKSLQKKDKEQASKQAAKDRLKLVLMQDRASVSPDFFEMMKQEIIDVIKKYIEIDEEALEVQLTRGIEAGLEGPALYANIPIKNVKPVAPKGEGEEDDDEVNSKLSEEEAEAVANNILENIESFAQDEKKEQNENEKKEENIENKDQNIESKNEEESEKNEDGMNIDNESKENESEEKKIEVKEDDEKEEVKKTTRKRTSTTTKASSTKKKTTTKKTTTKKTNA